MTEQETPPQQQPGPEQQQAPYHQGAAGYQQYGAYPPPTPPYKRLTRTSWDSPISGVCGGVARYLGLDPTLVRVLAVLLGVFTFPAFVIVYFIAWAVMPKE